MQNTFRVRFYYEQGEPRFGPNLSELRTVHQIKAEIVIQFIYLGGCRFNIRIFDINLSEICYWKNGCLVGKNVVVPTKVTIDISSDDQEDGSLTDFGDDDDDSEDEGVDYVDHEMLIHTFDLTADMMHGFQRLVCFLIFSKYVMFLIVFIHLKSILNLCHSFFVDHS